MSATTSSCSQATPTSPPPRANWRWRQTASSASSVSTTHSKVASSSLGLLTLNALTAAREVLIPMQAHFLALQGVGKLLETVRALAQGPQPINPRLKVAGVVLCMHDTSSTHTKEVVADLDGFFEAARSDDVPWRMARVFRPAIRRNIKLAECPSFGKSIFDYAPQATGAEDYKALADVFVRDWDAFLAAKGVAPVERNPEPPVVETRGVNTPSPSA